MLLVPAGREEQLDFAVCAQVFREPLREAPRTVRDLTRIPGSSGAGRRDAEALLVPQLARFERLSLRDRKQLFVAMSDVITWHGQPIPGLPPDDAAFLASLTG